MYRKDDNTLVVKKGYKEGMLTDAVIYADREIEKTLEVDAINQIINVTTLPGIVGNAIAMPDIHKGYGFPIGGVAAFDIEKGIISPGGIGYDINCGVRLISTSLKKEEVDKRKKELVLSLYSEVPLGVGSKGSIKLTDSDYSVLLKKGALWAVEKGYGNEEDLENIESKGFLDLEDLVVGRKAMERGRKQMGSLGSGNHFLEVQYIDEIFDEKAADELGFFKGQIFVMIHTGSRGFGHQICSDYVNIMIGAARKYGIRLYDKELSCAPFKSEEGQNYFNSMKAAANFAWANRQILKYISEKVFLKVFGISPKMLSFKTVYDVAHNIAKIEKHDINGEKKEVLVHRKGATRAFGPLDCEVSEKYRKFGQPVIIPGDMGRESYLLLGQNLSMNKSFGSSCHGAGRVMSRSMAIENAKGKDIKKELYDKGILLMAGSKDTIAEEMSDAYKDVSDVVKVIERVGISKRLLRLKPICVIKG
ncbi:MAG: RtcB family protein [Elusimicrobiota bacterium]